MISCVPNKWTYHSFTFTRLSNYLLHEGYGYYERADNEPLLRGGGGSQDSKCYVTTGVVGTKFVMMRYKCWVGRANGQIWELHNY